MRGSALGERPGLTSEPRAHKTRMPESIGAKALQMRRPATAKLSTHPQEQGAPGGPGGGSSSRKRTAIFIGLVILGVVVAIVVGGIAGWQISEAKNRGTAQTSSGGSSSGAGSGAVDGGRVQKILKPGSPLAATGFRYDGNYQIRIFCLAPEGVTPYTSGVRHGTWLVDYTGQGVRAPATRHYVACCRREHAT